jgi:hypothetical protein
MCHFCFNVRTLPTGASEGSLHVLEMRGDLGALEGSGGKLVGFAIANAAVDAATMARVLAPDSNTAGEDAA